MARVHVSPIGPEFLPCGRRNLCISFANLNSTRNYSCLWGPLGLNQRALAAGASQTSNISSEDPSSYEEVPTWCWTGSDAFSSLRDRHDAPPLPLPRLQGRPHRRVVLVRHGQSTWNARSRIQGSSDFSVLTEEGVRQAEATAALLSDWPFDVMFASPLKRAAHTARLVWGAREGPVVTLPALREIDLYSFQGLDKSAGRSTFPDAYESWQRDPALFTIDGHAPVRELWYRSSLAWQSILNDQRASNNVLVVAHNAVNQALIATALGLGPVHFRRITQSNAAFTVVNIEGGSANTTGNSKRKTQAEPSRSRVSIERLNNAPHGPLGREKLGRGGTDRLVLVSGAAGSPRVSTALRVLSDAGVEVPPLVAVGTPAAQAADIATALETTLRTPRSNHGRIILAVASPEACQQLVGMCLGIPGLGQRFVMWDGGVTMVHYLRGVNSLDKGVLLCTNYDPTHAFQTVGVKNA